MTMRPRSEEAQRTLDRTEQIIRQVLDTKELRVKPEARDFVGPSEEFSIADHISNFMSQYKEQKLRLAEYLVRIQRPHEIWMYTQETVDQMMADILQTAQDFLRVIDKAYSYDLIEEGESSRRKLEDCMKERDDLKAELERLSPEYLKLQALYEDCQKKLRIQRI
jgi:hypothetical protein